MTLTKLSMLCSKPYIDINVPKRTLCMYIVGVLAATVYLPVMMDVLLCC